MSILYEKEEKKKRTVCILSCTTRRKRKKKSGYHGECETKGMRKRWLLGRGGTQNEERQKTRDTQGQLFPQDIHSNLWTDRTPDRNKDPGTGSCAVGVTRRLACSNANSVLRSPSSVLTSTTPSSAADATLPTPPVGSSILILRWRPRFFFFDPRGRPRPRFGSAAGWGLSRWFAAGGTG